MLVFAVTLGFAFSPGASADRINATIQFDKRPAKAALLYVPKPEVKPLSGAAWVWIDQENKKFTRRMSVVGSESTLVFLNSDTFDHNIFASDKELGVQFDIGLMAPGVREEVAITWPENTVLSIGCKIHPRMRSYIANIPDSYYRVIEFERKRKEYDVDLELPAMQSGMVHLMVTGYEDIRAQLSTGAVREFPLIRKGARLGTVVLTWTGES